MTDTRFLPPTAWRGRIAPTEDDPWRGRVLRGEVHDENAARLDGVSGHAGLFSSARDLLRFGDWLLGELGCPGGRPGDGRKTGSGQAAPDNHPDVPHMDAAVVRRFASRQDLPPGSSRALGWDTPTEGGSGGSRLSPRSIGHTGFTGTSIWLDPDRCLAIVLLSNRVHPTRQNTRWGPVRGLVADAVVNALAR
jgi:CubicO group peptidase (beta-lactamase class C family)